MMRWKYGLFGTLILLTSACAVGPNHKAPEVPAPEVFRGTEKATEESFADLPWWELYQDPSLFSLIKTATEDAYDLRIALARVEVARQAHRAAIWSLAPTIGVQGGVGDAVGSPSIPSFYPPPSATGNFGLGVGASWEPDVWGRLRRYTEMAEADFHAASEDRRGVYIILVGDVAELYFDLTTLDLQKRYMLRAIDTRSETLKLFEERSGGGVGNGLEVARAQAAVNAVEAEVTTIKLTTATKENALSFLLARAPGELSKRSTLDALAAPPAVPVGIPSTLLTRRPDIRSAEKRLLAANARIGYEKADFFPKFELTAFLGVASPDLTEAQMVRGGAGLFSWTLPFLGGERERAEYDAARAAWKGTAAIYERTVVNAFREVADALAAVSTLRDRSDALQNQVAALETAEQLAVERYRGGISNYLEVLTAQEDSLGAQLQLAAVRGARHTALARLYRSLGGGWPLPDEAEAEADAEKKSSKN
jgi:multidrug efflux system outer membrane protein